MSNSEGEDSLFVYDFLERAFKISGGDLPLHLEMEQKKFKEYRCRMTSNINDSISLVQYDIVRPEEYFIKTTSSIRNKKEKELLDNYTHANFLKYMSHFARSSAKACRENNFDLFESLHMFLKTSISLLEKMRKDNLFNDDSWELLDEAAAAIIEERGERKTKKSVQSSSSAAISEAAAPVSGVEKEGECPDASANTSSENNEQKKDSENLTDSGVHDKSDESVRQSNDSESQVDSGVHDNSEVAQPSSDTVTLIESNESICPPSPCCLPFLRRNDSNENPE